MQGAETDATEDDTGHQRERGLDVRCHTHYSSASLPNIDLLGALCPYMQWNPDRLRK
jgi:hypothetical protein